MQTGEVLRPGEAAAARSGEGARIEALGAGATGNAEALGYHDMPDLASNDSAGGAVVPAQEALDEATYEGGWGGQEEEMPALEPATEEEEEEEGPHGVDGDGDAAHELMYPFNQDYWAAMNDVQLDNVQIDDVQWVLPQAPELQGPEGGTETRGQGENLAAPLLQALRQALPLQCLSQLRTLGLCTLTSLTEGTQLGELAVLCPQLERLLLEVNSRSRMGHPGLPAMDSQLLKEVFIQVGQLPKLMELKLVGLQFMLDSQALTDTALVLNSLTKLSFEGRLALRAGDEGVFQCLPQLQHLELMPSRADMLTLRPKLSLTWLPQGLLRLDLRQIEVLPNAVSGFSALRQLRLRDCAVSNVEAFGSCPALELFQHNMFDRSRRDLRTQNLLLLQPLLPMWPALQTLDISFHLHDVINPQVLEAQLQAICLQLRDLRNLALSGLVRSRHTYQHMHQGLAQLTKLSCLRRLHLCPVSAQAVSEVARLTGLVHLCLEQVPTYAVHELTTLTALRTLQYSEDTFFSFRTPSCRTLHIDPVQLQGNLACALPLTNIHVSRGPTHGFSAFL